MYLSSLLWTLRLRFVIVLFLVGLGVIVTLIIDFAQPASYSTKLEVRVVAQPLASFQDSRISSSPSMATIALKKFLMMDTFRAGLPESLLQACGKDNSNSIRATAPLDTPFIDVQVVCETQSASRELAESVTTYLSSENFEQLWGLDALAYGVEIANESSTNETVPLSRLVVRDIGVGAFLGFSVALFWIFLRENLKPGLYSENDVHDVQEDLVLASQEVFSLRAFEHRILELSRSASEPVILLSRRGKAGTEFLKKIGQKCDRVSVHRFGEFLEVRSSSAGIRVEKPLLLIDVKTITRADFQLWISETKSWTSFPETRVALVRT